jgi:hypothetical protein
VEHSCAQCGTLVEDGRPFCPQCRAPQVRVQVAAPDLEAAPSLVSVSPGLGTPGSASDRPFPEIPQPGFSTRPTTVDRKIAVRAALLAGGLGFFINVIPFLGIVLTGSLAVYLYRRASGVSVPASAGSRLGGAAGAVSFAISSVFMAIRIFVFHALQEYQDLMLKVANALGLNSTDPEVQDMIHRLSTPSGLAITLLFSLVIGVALAAIGGAVASAVLQPRSRA